MSRPSAVDLAARVTSGAARPAPSEAGSSTNSSTTTSAPPATASSAEAIAELQQQVRQLLAAQELTNATSENLVQRVDALHRKVATLRATAPESDRTQRQD